MAELMKSMGGGAGGAGGMPDFGDEDGEDGDDDDLPALETPDAGKGKGKEAAADSDDMPPLEGALVDKGVLPVKKCQADLHASVFLCLCRGVVVHQARSASTKDADCQ